MTEKVVLKTVSKATLMAPPELFATELARLPSWRMLLRVVSTLPAISFSHPLQVVETTMEA